MRFRRRPGQSSIAGSSRGQAKCHALSRVRRIAAENRLADLDDFPFVKIKVDQGFISGCADDQKKQRVCRSILKLANDYGARTVAEGVETRAQDVSEVMFSGDLLFAGSIGRTDLPGGDLQTLLNSIRTVLFAFPDDTPVHSGHGPETTIGAERRSNPFLT